MPLTESAPHDVTPGVCVVLDFDGTLTARDVGDEICERFAPGSWRDFDARWIRREITLPEAQRGMWELARGTRAQMQSYAAGVAALRPGALALVAAVRAAGARLVVASGGFDFYIRPALDAAGIAPDALHCNEARWRGERMTPVFNAEGLACAHCAVCKGRVCERERARGAVRVVFIGDGSSDRCVLGRADAIAAVRGGILEAECRSLGTPCVAFEDLRELIPLVRGS